MQNQPGAFAAGQRTPVVSTARKTRQRISYVLPLANATAGHRLGVNGLAYDRERSLLYTAGRDGVIYAWNVPPSAPVSPPPTTPSTSSPPPPAAQPAGRYRKHVQAHTHWINDIVLVSDNYALASASSDNSVKLWRPHAEDARSPKTIGLHTDYVKTLASPGRNSRWLASGGLDRQIILWDLERGGQRLQIQSSDDEVSGKGSVYALCANDNLVVSGGPESVVKVWDVRSGKRVTQFVGHTDNVRSVMISQDNEIIISASSDQTVKVWSVLGGRSLHTLTMHNDSVWSLYSDHPQLSVFYSGDRAGFVAKTDTRGTLDINDGLSVAVCQEQEGVNKIITSGTSFWTATASSSVNRWADVDTSVGLQLPDNMSTYRFGNSARSRASVASQTSVPANPQNPSAQKIPLNCILRISNTANWPPLHLRTRPERGLSNQTMHARKTSGAVTVVEPEIGAFEPLRSLPEGTIQGQNGLTRHVLLNDRHRALTVDTSGEVMLWDLLLCTPIKSFGKRPLDDVVPEINTNEMVSHWCNVDTRTGMLRCVLEQNHCFDAEIYADELKEAEYMEFREDQRINLGKWVLRYLFATLLDEEIRRDEAHRQTALGNKASTNGRAKPNFSIALPQSGSYYIGSGTSTPRAANGLTLSLKTPGLAIGLASPGPLSPALPKTANGSGADDVFRPSIDRPSDYFSAKTVSPDAQTSGAATPKAPSEAADDRAPLSPSESEKKESGFKKFRLSFAGKKLSRAQTMDAKASATREDDLESASSKPEEPVFDDNFLGTVQRIRHEYTMSNIDPSNNDSDSLILPALPNELPVLKPPLNTTVIIQEESSDSAGIQDVYEGPIGNLGRNADHLERVAPFWLGELLLRNRIPQKEIVKVSFTLEPYNKELPIITANEGTERLNANRMLRARKILAYISEKLEALPHTDITPALPSSSPAKPQPPPPPPPRSQTNPYRKTNTNPFADPSSTTPSSPPSSASSPPPASPPPQSPPEPPRPEDWLILYCQDKPVPLKMTLATIRTQIWKGGGDVALYYKANTKRRKLVFEGWPPPLPPAAAIPAAGVGGVTVGSQTVTGGVVRGR